MMMDLFVFGTSHQIFDGYTNKIEKAPENFPH